MTAALAISDATLDLVITAQLAVAWAGEGGEEPRLGWWRTDLVSEFGGLDLFERLLPGTFRWAAFQAAREAARRHDATMRQKEHDPDRLISLFRFGFEIDERLDERLRELKGAGREPLDALPGLREVVGPSWQPDAFRGWVASHGAPEVNTVPVGRRIKGDCPGSLEARVGPLVGALAPVEARYPLPHYRVRP